MLVFKKIGPLCSSLRYVSKALAISFFLLRYVPKKLSPLKILLFLRRRDKSCPAAFPENICKTVYAPVHLFFGGSEVAFSYF